MNVVRSLKSRQGPPRKPRNPVLAAQKAGRSGAGAHRKPAKALRRAQKAALARQLEE